MPNPFPSNAGPRRAEWVRDVCGVAAQTETLGQNATARPTPSPWRRVRALRSDARRHDSQRSGVQPWNGIRRQLLPFGRGRASLQTSLMRQEFAKRFEASRKSSACDAWRLSKSSSPLLSRSVQYRPRIRLAGRPETSKNAEPLCIRLRVSTRLSGRLRYMYAKDGPAPSFARLASDEREEDSSVSRTRLMWEDVWRTTRKATFGVGLAPVAEFTQKDVRVPFHVPFRLRGTSLTRCAI